MTPFVKPSIGKSVSIAHTATAIAIFGPFTPGDMVEKAYLLLGTTIDGAQQGENMLLSIRVFNSIAPSPSAAVFNANGRALCDSGVIVARQLNEDTLNSAYMAHCNNIYPLNHLVTDSERYIGFLLDASGISTRDMAGSLFLDVCWDQEDIAEIEMAGEFPDGGEHSQP